MGQGMTKKTHRCGRLAVRVPLLMHHRAGDASRASAGGGYLLDGEGGKLGRGGITRRLCLVCRYIICGWWIGFPGQAMSPLRGVGLAGTGNRGGGNKLRRSMLAVPVGK